MLSDQQLYDNRMKWINFLVEDGRLKADGQLESKEDNNARCCLGHACHILGVRRSITSEAESLIAMGQVQYGTLYPSWTNAPQELVDLLGLKDNMGGGVNPHEIDAKDDGGNLDISSLARLNDRTNWTPKQIGDYLETVVYGGTNTPFTPIFEELAP